MNRGHRAGTLFRDDTDRRRFLGLLTELPERFELEVHAFLLMDAHCPLLVRTLQANLSKAIRWLKPGTARRAARDGNATLENRPSRR